MRKNIVAFCALAVLMFCHLFSGSRSRSRRRAREDPVTAIARASTVSSINICGRRRSRCVETAALRQRPLHREQCRVATGRRSLGHRDGSGDYKIYMDDPEAGQVGFSASPRKTGTPVFRGTRLKIVDHKVSEIETLVARPEGRDRQAPEAPTN